MAILAAIAVVVAFVFVLGCLLHLAAAGDVTIDDGLGLETAEHAASLHWPALVYNPADVDTPETLASLRALADGADYRLVPNPLCPRGSAFLVPSPGLSVSVPIPTL